MHLDYGIGLFDLPIVFEETFYAEPCLRGKFRESPAQSWRQISAIVNSFALTQGTFPHYYMAYSATGPARVSNSSVADGSRVVCTEI